MSRRIGWVFLLVAISCYPFPLCATEATIYIGQQYPISKLFRVNATGILFGGRISTGRVIGFEQSIGYSPSFLYSALDTFNMQSNLVLGIPVGKVTPYGTVGLGLLKTWGSGAFGNKFTFNYGGGMKFPRLAGPLSLRIDVRGYRVSGIPFTGAGGIITNTNPLHFLEASGGVVFSW
jgi:hypothetical protein